MKCEKQMLARDKQRPANFQAQLGVSVDKLYLNQNGAFTLWFSYSPPGPQTRRAGAKQLVLGNALSSPLPRPRRCLDRISLCAQGCLGIERSNNDDKVKVAFMSCCGAARRFSHVFHDKGLSSTYSFCSSPSFCHTFSTSRNYTTADELGTTCVFMMYSLPLYKGPRWVFSTPYLWIHGRNQDGGSTIVERWICDRPLTSLGLILFSVFFRTVLSSSRALF